MNTFLTKETPMWNLVEICGAVYFAAIVVELVLCRKWLRFLLELLVCLGVLVLGLFVSGSRNGTVSFGPPGTSPVATVGIMFAATVLGIGARFVFYLEKNKFSWLDLLKPVAISPMVLLPLMGSVQTMTDLTPMQVVSFSVLAFQNGFFWQAVLAGAKPASLKARGK